MPSGIPSKMRALVLHAYGESWDSLVPEERPVPRPGPGEVLVRIAASPVNPSDLLFMRGLYGVPKKLPATPGFEGSGRVVATGAGFFTRRLLGKRVACVISQRRDGTWAEYAVPLATECLPLPDSMSDEQGAMALINPLTAWGLMEVVRRHKARSMVNTAAASALGRMLLRLGKRLGIEIVHVVRRENQVALLRSLGASHVLNSAEPDFDGRLRDLCGTLEVRLAFDAVGGEMTGRLLSGLPQGSRVIVYGALSMEECKVPPGTVLFEDKVVEGFYLPRWIAQKSLPQLLLLRRNVARLLATDLRSEIRARVPLEDAASALTNYTRTMTEGKIIFVPQKSATQP